MKTIFLTIIHYGSSNREHLFKCLKSYDSFENYAITIHLFITQDFDCSQFTKLNIIKHILPESLGEHFVNECKPVIYENRHDFDYYIYCEDDVLITKENFETFVSIQSKLSLPYICGFLRYELRENDDYKYLIDNHPVHSCHRGGNTIIKDYFTINGDEYFEPYNVHQGCHILTKEQMKYLEEYQPQYFKKESLYAGVREGCASDVYVSMGLIKVISTNETSKLMVHHLANKYVYMHPAIYTKDSTPDDMKIKNMRVISSGGWQIKTAYR